MFNPKTKGLFIDVSEFSILAARTTGYKVPMVIEELTEYSLSADDTPEEIRGFFEQLVDFKGAGYFVSRAGVYPEGRFVRYYEAESNNKAKDLNFLSGVLKSEFNVDPDVSTVSILNAKDGSDFDPNSSLSKRLVFCGGPVSAFQAEQDRLLSYGIYPERLELSTVTTLGGVSDYAHFNEIKSPILCFELTSQSANIFIINQGQVDVARPVPFGLDSIYPLLQRELGLKDESSARKLFFSNTFDFAEMGPKLLRRMTKELQASTGFYEVQTGLTIEKVFISVLPQNLAWVSKTVADSLGLEIMQPNLEKWLEGLKINLGEGVEVSNLGSRWMGLFSLMGEFHLREEGESE
ncbi:hypothetical protein QEH59_01325 [Coraliomargarita sp. SDUM461004]|uniref:Uncharacterized protein n=1 Tax=Thalassobacterium sedimentorum TaxID=3041258 RepID=A0ABU1AE71_9BACT|nr:hypothetical protein [Coraliomargarita sp. SDUM461004]MDQ8193047.1 hypothetical protein [Coraliomargarita sp. SDUM461004]